MAPELPATYASDGESSHASAPIKVNASPSSTSSDGIAKPPPKRLFGKDLDDEIDPNYVPKEGSGAAKDREGHHSAVGKLFYKAKRFSTEGHTVWDSLLSNASATIGQVIQVYPHQVALMGMIPALIIAVVTQFLNYFTLYLLVILFLERKRKMVRFQAEGNILLKPDFK